VFESGSTHLGTFGQQGAEVVLQEVFHLLVEGSAVLQQLLQLVDGELARGTPATAARVIWRENEGL
jgi:hypothetical protein